MTDLKIEYLPVTALKPYERNPRKVDRAVDYVANSIREFGFKVPIVDAVPVVHGHWEIVPNDENRDDYYKMRCSVCGETLWSIQSEELYCCKCGAKMDECADGERRE